MNSLVIYFSKFGNTQRIAETIAETLRSQGYVDVRRIDKFTVSDLTSFDLVVMGVPTHRMNLPADVRTFLKTLPRRILAPHASVAAFDTSYKMSWWLSYLSAARKLFSRLKRLGGKRIIPPESFHVMESKGPLYDGEIERAKNWALLILKRAEERMR